MPTASEVCFKCSSAKDVPAYFRIFRMSDATLRAQNLNMKVAAAGDQTMQNKTPATVQKTKVTFCPSTLVGRKWYDLYHPHHHHGSSSSEADQQMISDTQAMDYPIFQGPVCLCVTAL